MPDHRTLSSPRVVGLAFPLPELAAVRDWAAAVGLILAVRLDYVADSAAIEELLTLRDAENRRAFTLWRGRRAVIGQSSLGFPQEFVSIEAALRAADLHFRPATPRRGRWRSLLPF